MFEPLRDCFEESRRTMAGTPGFTAFNVALGESDGEVAFFRSEFSPSSSRTDAVLAEVGYSSLYKGQATIQEISGLLDDCGFAFMGIVDQYLRPSDSLPVYSDALFVSRAALERCGNVSTSTAVMPIAGPSMGG